MSAVAWRYLAHVGGAVYATSRWFGMDELHHYGANGDLVSGPHPDWQQVEYAYSYSWQPIETAPKDGTYLVANAKGQVAPWIRGVIHNNVGTAWDWHYGEAATHWQPLPPPPRGQP